MTFNLICLFSCILNLNVSSARILSRADESIEVTPLLQKGTVGVIHLTIQAKSFAIVDRQTTLSGHDKWQQ